MFEDLARKDSERYSQEMKNYSQNLSPSDINEQKEKRKTRKKKRRYLKHNNKDPINKIKKPMSSFMIFANEIRPEIKRAEPELKITDIGRRLGERWRALLPEEKKVTLKCFAIGYLPNSNYNYNYN